MLHSGTQAVVLQCDSNTVWHAVRRCVAIRGEVGPLMLMADLPEPLDLIGRHATCSHCRVKVVNVGGNNIELNLIATKLNHCPRRVLGWGTSAEAFGAAEPKPMLLAPTRSVRFLGCDHG